MEEAHLEAKEVMEDIDWEKIGKEMEMVRAEVESLLKELDLDIDFDFDFDLDDDENTDEKADKNLDF